MSGDTKTQEERKLAERIETILGEFRIMVPALAALLGFQLISAMQSSYPDLPVLDRALNFAGVCSTIVALVSMLVPSAYHRVVPRLHEDESFIPFAQRCLTWGFAAFGLSLSLALYLQALRTFHERTASLAIGAAALVTFAVAWWAVPRRLAAAAGEKRRPAERDRA